MAQIKIYGLNASLSKYAGQLLVAIRGAVMEALSYPPKKISPIQSTWAVSICLLWLWGKSYTIIEISMFQGRTVDAKKNWSACCLRTSSEKQEFFLKMPRLRFKNHRNIIGVFGENVPTN